MGRTVFFSDLYQIPIDKNSREITAFSTEKGSFQWKVLPFGLNISPNSFSRMMNLAFTGLSSDKLFIYIDDIIVLGKNKTDHLKNINNTFQKCRENNLKINPTK